MNSLPPLKPLVSFRSAARHSSFTKAAQELNLTHGAVSRAVKQLEEFYGFKLFERRNRGLFLTGRGRKLAVEIESVLDQLEKISEEIRHTESKRRISVSCEPSLAMRWLMPALEKFRNICPQVDVHLSTGGGPIDLTAEGVHLAIRRSDFIWPTYYCSTVLGKEKIGPVCSLAYWEKHRFKPLEILHTRTRPQAWTDWRRISGENPEIASEKYFDHFYFSLKAATTGFGVAIGPEPMVREDISQKLLIAPYGFRTTDVDYVILSIDPPKKNSDLSSFIDWVASEFQQP
jgi:DNA-binding transcriptional LysR family regulator